MPAIYGYTDSDRTPIAYEGDDAFVEDKVPYGWDNPHGPSQFHCTIALSEVTTWSGHEKVSGGSVRFTSATVVNEDTGLVETVTLDGPVYGHDKLIRIEWQADALNGSLTWVFTALQL